MSPNQNCKALVISCIDYRFVSRVGDYLASENLQGSYDLITIPGASLNVGEAESSAKISFKLHEPEIVMIFDHEDCGAYGEDNSSERHIRNLTQAKDKIKSINPKVDVKTFIAGFEEVKEIN